MAAGSNKNRLSPFVFASIGREQFASPIEAGVRKAVGEVAGAVGP